MADDALHFSGVYASAGPLLHEFVSCFTHTQRPDPVAPPAPCTRRSSPSHHKSNRDTISGSGAPSLAHAAQSDTFSAQRAREHRACRTRAQPVLHMCQQQSSERYRSYGLTIRASYLSASNPSFKHHTSSADCVFTGLSRPCDCPYRIPGAHTHRQPLRTQRPGGGGVASTDADCLYAAPSHPSSILHAFRQAEAPIGRSA